MHVDRPVLEFTAHWMNAAGTMGYAPPAHWPLVDPPAAFVTNPISCSPREPARERAVEPFPGGFLLHTGLPSPGYRAVIRDYAERWARSPVQIWVHLMGENPPHVARMVRRFEEMEAVAAIELSFPYHICGGEILDLIRAALGELPLVLAVPIDRIRESWLPQAVQLGLAALSMAPPRGTLMAEDGRTIHGRLYGPALLPLARAALDYLKAAGLPVIAAGGVASPSEIDWLSEAGAAAVQLDFVLWRGWQPASSD